MKQLKQIFRAGLFVMLAAFSLQAVAATQAVGREFNHMATGFPLSGGHATASCETCHVGGVFKGTPRTCDGCHALGKRIIATPKSNAHIVTDAPCEVCHFNTATFLGARYNHGNAQPQQCKTCHNGRMNIAQPASHNTGKKLTESCDNCHRSSTWLPASWNHVGVAPGTCDTCHTPGGQSSISKPASHTANLIKGQNQCDDCHIFTGWYPNRFKHNTAALCSTCHLNGVQAKGQPTSHASFTGWPMECNQCHFNTISFLNALGSKPGNHIPENPGTPCASCHTGLAKVSIPVLHSNSSASTCATCHISPNPYTGSPNGQKTKKSHSGSSGSNCTNCHKGSGSYSNWSN